MDQSSPFRTTTKYCHADPTHRGAILITYEIDDQGHTSVRASIQGRKSLNARAVFKVLKDSKVLYGVLKYALREYEQYKNQQQ